MYNSFSQPMSMNRTLVTCIDIGIRNLCLSTVCSVPNSPSRYPKVIKWKNWDLVNEIKLKSSEKENKSKKAKKVTVKNIRDEDLRWVLNKVYEENQSEFQESVQIVIEKQLQSSGLLTKVAYCLYMMLSLQCGFEKVQFQSARVKNNFIKRELGIPLKTSCSYKENKANAVTFLLKHYIPEIQQGWGSNESDLCKEILAISKEIENRKKKYRQDKLDDIADTIVYGCIYCEENKKT